VYAEISQAFEKSMEARAESHRQQPSPRNSTQLSNRQGNPR
jgi:hypothetical protein